MPLDGIMLGAVIRELQRLEGGRIDKVSQPERDEIVLTIRSGGENLRLLLSASPSNARIHLTQESKPNPAAPPALCMLLRKRLLGGRILGIEQVRGDRVALVRVESPDEMGDITEKRLVLEIMGRHSNLIFVDGENRILDSAHHVPLSVSRVRQVLPGLPYADPPGEARADPGELDPQQLYALLEEAREPFHRALQGRINGLSPASCREVLATGGLTEPYPSPAELAPERLAVICQGMDAFFRRIREGDYAPLLLSWDGGLEALPFPYATLAGVEEPMSASQALEATYRRRDHEQRQAQRSLGLRQALNTHLERNRRKQQVLRETLLSSKDMDAFRIRGELLTAQLWRAEAGARSVEVDDYYAGGTVTLELDPRLTPAENAQRYFKRYQKLKNAAVAAREQLEAALEEENYLESLLQSAQACDREDELAEIRQEMAQAGYLKPVRVKQKLSPSRPLLFQAADGREILVGRNNLQNDTLTLRTAAKTDLWLHVKDRPGSHVILRTENRPVPPEIEREAALLAARYSSAGESANVPVDITLVKHVRKPSGSRPGFVIYDHQHTLYVTPELPER